MSLLSEAQLETAYRVAGYLVLYHTCSDKLLEHQPMLSSLYNTADAKWREGAFRPHILPLVGNQLPAVHFSKLISWLDKKNPSELLQVQCQCWTALQVIKSEELVPMGITGHQIKAAAHHIAAQEYLKRHALTSLGAESRLDPVAELQVVPSLTPYGVNLPLLPPPDASLIGRTIQYRDRNLCMRDQITKCFVNDVGSSELRGIFYEVIFNDVEVLTISEEEMMDILSRETHSVDELDSFRNLHLTF